jgi:hypothetical protein
MFFELTADKQRIDFLQKALQGKGGLKLQSTAMIAFEKVLKSAYRSYGLKRLIEIEKDLIKLNKDKSLSLDVHDLINLVNGILLPSEILDTLVAWMNSEVARLKKEHPSIKQEDISIGVDMWKLYPFAITFRNYFNSLSFRFGKKLEIELIDWTTRQLKSSENHLITKAYLSSALSYIFWYHELRSEQWTSAVIRAINALSDVLKKSPNYMMQLIASDILISARHIEITNENMKVALETLSQAHDTCRKGWATEYDLQRANEAFDPTEEELDEMIKNTLLDLQKKIAAGDPHVGFQIANAPFEDIVQYTLPLEQAAEQLSEKELKKAFLLSIESQPEKNGWIHHWSIESVIFRLIDKKFKDFENPLFEMLNRVTNPLTFFQQYNNSEVYFWIANYLVVIHKNDLYSILLRWKQTGNLHHWMTIAVASAIEIDLGSYDVEIKTLGIESIREVLKFESIGNFLTTVSALNRCIFYKGISEYEQGRKEPQTIKYLLDLVPRNYYERWLQDLLSEEVSIPMFLTLGESAMDTFIRLKAKPEDRPLLEKLLNRGILKNTISQLLSTL